MRTPQGIDVLRAPLGAASFQLQMIYKEVDEAEVALDLLRYIETNNVHFTFSALALDSANSTTS